MRRLGWWVLRRLVVTPLMPVLAVVFAVSWVLTAAVSVVGEPLTALLRRHSPRVRPLRLVTFGVLYFAGETVCLLVCLAVWVGSGFGLWRDRGWVAAAYRSLLDAFLGGVVLAARLVFGFRVVVEEPVRHPDDVLRAGSDSPVVVLARHAGPGASFALVQLLISRYGRHVRVVLKQQLRLDPSMDILLSHNGCTWLDAHAPQGEPARKVREAAAALRGRDALVLFPEGADWTPVRHLQAVARLRYLGLVKQARAALRMPHVLPPRPAGTLAALQGSPGADVLVFSHTGHDRLLDTASTWAALPLRTPLRMIWWRIPAAEVPRAEDDVADWLQQAWQDIDSWIDEQQDLQLLRDRPRR